MPLIDTTQDLKFQIRTINILNRLIVELEKIKKNLSKLAEFLVYDELIVKISNVISDSRKIRKEILKEFLEKRLKYIETLTFSEKIGILKNFCERVLIEINNNDDLNFNVKEILKKNLAIYYEEKTLRVIKIIALIRINLYNIEILYKKLLILNELIVYYKKQIDNLLVYLNENKEKILSKELLGRNRDVRGKNFTLIIIRIKSINFELKKVEGNWKNFESNFIEKNDFNKLLKLSDVLRRIKDKEIEDNLRKEDIKNLTNVFSEIKVLTNSYLIHYSKNQNKIDDEIENIVNLIKKINYKFIIFFNEFGEILEENIRLSKFVAEVKKKFDKFYSEEID